MCGRGVSPGVGMESEQRGRTSRASSTSSLGREVRCGCQYYQSDSLLPERRALLVRPSSRTMQQPPAVRCRSVSPYQHRTSTYRPSRNRRETRWPILDHVNHVKWSLREMSILLLILVAHQIGYTVRNSRRVPSQLFKVRPGGYR